MVIYNFLSSASQINQLSSAEKRTDSAILLLKELSELSSPDRQEVLNKMAINLQQIDAIAAVISSQKPIDQTLCQVAREYVEAYKLNVWNTATKQPDEKDDRAVMIGYSGREIQW